MPAPVRGRGPSYGTAWLSFSAGLVAEEDWSRGSGRMLGRSPAQSWICPTFSTTLINWSDVVPSGGQINLSATMIRACIIADGGKRRARLCKKTNISPKTETTNTTSAPNYRSVPYHTSNKLLACAVPVARNSAAIPVRSSFFICSSCPLCDLGCHGRWWSLDCRWLRFQLYGHVHHERWSCCRI